MIMVGKARVERSGDEAPARPIVGELARLGAFRASVVSAACAFLLAACSAAEPDAVPTFSDMPATDRTLPSNGGLPDTSSTANESQASFSADYPPGPYGEASPLVGEALQDLQLQGFVNVGGDGLATLQPFGSYSFGELRQSGARYALIITAAVWCPSCKSGALDLGARGKEVIDAGGALVELLLDGSSVGTPPTRGELYTWVEAAELTVTTVGPIDGSARQVFADRDFAYIVDLETMKVLWRMQSVYADPTIVEVAIDELLTGYL